MEQGCGRETSVKDTRIRGEPEKGTTNQPRKAENFRGGYQDVKRG